MDRFLPSALVSAALAAGLLGCQNEPSGEYRTYTEAQSDDRPAGEPSDQPEAPVKSAEPAESPEADMSPEPAASPDLDNALTIPIEPEMAPEPKTGTAKDDGAGNELLAVTGVEPTSPAPAIEAAKFSQAASGIDPAEGLASRGNMRPDLNEPGASGSLTDLSEAPAEARQIELLVPEKTFKSEGPEGAIRVSYDDLDLLKVLNMEPVPEDAVSHFPDWLSGLNGERIRIRGFMYPTFQSTGLAGFVLARDNDICCFGRNPKIYDLIEVAMRDGVTTDYIQGRPFDVVGVLHIQAEWDADEQKLVRLYQIDDAIVINR